MQSPEPDKLEMVKNPNESVTVDVSPIGRVLLSLILAAVGICICGLQYRGRLVIEYDSGTYAAFLRNLADGDVLKPLNIFPMGLPLLGVPLYKLGVPPHCSLLFCSWVSFVIILYSSHTIVSKSVGRAYALAACICITLLPCFSDHLWLGTSELPFSAAIALMAVLLCRPMGIGNSLALGLSGALACHIRYPGLFVFLGLPFVQFLRCRQSKEGLRHFVILCSSLTLGTAPLFLRNYLSSGDLVWMSPNQSPSMGSTFALWIGYHFRAILAIPQSIVEEVRRNSETWIILFIIGALSLFGISYLTWRNRRCLPVFMLFSVGFSYAAFMVGVRAPVESRYLQPELLLLLLWGILIIGIESRRFPEFAKLTMGALMFYSALTASYMLVVGYNAGGRPNAEECLKELRSVPLSRALPILVDGNGWGVSAMFNNYYPQRVSFGGSNSVLPWGSMPPCGVVVSMATRRSKSDASPVFPEWVNLCILESQRPDSNLRRTYSGKWTQVFDYEHNISGPGGR